jgi:osmotically-inducible protein OsmY
MKKTRTLMLACLVAGIVPALQGCFPLVATGVTVGVLAAKDRRSLGTQTEDEAIELKFQNRLDQRYGDRLHVNGTSYNRRVLLTGEVGTDSDKAAVEELAGKIENVQGVINEVRIAGNTSFSSRSNDAYITSKVKARFIDANRFGANHVKVYTEAGTVYLLGLVTEREATDAIEVTRHTGGVGKVVNVMEIISDAEARRVDANAGSSAGGSK